jgi:predicted nicotinamide N-methyase
LSVVQLDHYLQSLLPGACLQAQSLPQCPRVSLYLINADFPRHALAADIALRLMDEPPYWAFCWASGQVLAQVILANPAWVDGKHVVDFGAGSGVVGIAAALAGAASVTCVDCDPLAQQAIIANAELNKVSVLVADTMPAQADLLTIADVLYDRENLPLVQQLMGCAAEVLLADSRIKNLVLPPFVPEGEYLSSTWPDLDESAEFNCVRLYRAALA